CTLPCMLVDSAYRKRGHAVSKYALAARCNCFFGKRFCRSLQFTRSGDCVVVVLDHKNCRRSVGTRKVDAFIEVTLGSTAVACVSDGYQIFAALFDAQRNTCSLYILRTDDDLWTECIHACRELVLFKVSS